MSFLDDTGPVAVIAGGSEGVGASYAHLLARHGLDIVIVARDAEPLDKLAAELAAQYPDRNVTTVAADLTDAGTPERIAHVAQSLEVGLLIYNAGSSAASIDFVDNDLVI